MQRSLVRAYVCAAIAAACSATAAALPIDAVRAADFITVSGSAVAGVVTSGAGSRTSQSGGVRQAIDPDLFEPASWSQLLRDGSIAHRRIEADGSSSLSAPASAPVLLIELYATLIEPQRIGRNLVGEANYLLAMARLEPGDAAILVAANGLYSFKGTSFVRTGEFDRIRILQDGREFRLHAEQHRRIDVLLAEGAPELREIGLFVIPRASGFDHLRPWTVQVTIPRSGDAAAPLVVDVPYHLPGTYLIAASAAAAAPAPPAAAIRPRTAPEWQVSDALAEGVGMILVTLSALIAGFVAILFIMQRQTA